MKLDALPSPAVMVTASTLQYSSAMCSDVKSLRQCVFLDISFKFESSVCHEKHIQNFYFCHAKYVQ